MNLYSENYLEGAVKYLDLTGQLTKIQDIIKNSIVTPESETKNEPLSIVIYIDYILFLEIADETATFLLHEPHLCNKLFYNVIRLVLKETSHRLRTSLKTNIQASLQIALPPLKSLIPFVDNGNLPNTGLLVIKGILVSCTVPLKYCKSVVYRCPVKGCPEYKGRRVFYNQQGAGVCGSCGCNREEFLNARVNGDEVIAVFVTPIAFKTNFTRHQGIKVHLKDSLIEGLSLGESYNVVATSEPPNFNAWGIEKTTMEHRWRFDKNLPTIAIPKSIVLLKEYLRKMCSNSPWALTTTLASQIASHLYPLNSLFQLKCGLLLSLASQTIDRTGVPLLAVGPDCSALLQAATQLSERRVTITAPSLCGPITGSMDGSWMEAGPLLLATGGICNLGDWAKFGSGRSSAASQVVTALESGQVDMVVSNNSMGSPPSFPLRCVVWTIWSGDKVTSSAQAQLRTLIEVFGLPFIGDGSADVEAIAKHLLHEAMHQTARAPENFISPEDLKQYINIASSFNVQLTLEASRLLRNYFVASRRERPDCLPLTAIKTMTALAEAHARLCLRSQVLYEDVVLVVYLYEEAITALYGFSVMSPPLNMFASLSTDLPIGQQMDNILKNFSAWLEQYIKSLLSESSVNSSLPEE